MEVSYNIVDKLGVLHTTSGGWSFEVNTVAWNGGSPKLDVRNWCHESGKVGKGITLSDDEVRELVKVLSAYLAGKKEVSADE